MLTDLVGLGLALAAIHLASGGSNRNGRSFGMSRRGFSYGRTRVAVIGNGHSAQNVLRDLAALAEERPGGSITWVVRRADPGQLFGGRSDDVLPERGRLGTDAEALVASYGVHLAAGVRVTEIRPTEAGVILVD